MLVANFQESFLASFIMIGFLDNYKKPFYLRVRLKNSSIGCECFVNCATATAHL